MPKVKVETNSKMSPADAFKKIRSLLEGDKDLRKMDSTYQCKFNDNSLSGTAKGSKFSADMKVVDQGEVCTVIIEVDLPLILAPVKGVVQSTLQKKLDAALA
jgi:hypothetical protein